MDPEEESHLTYESSIIGKEKKIVQKFTSGGEDIRVNVYGFSNEGDESPELFLSLVKDFDNLVATYSLFTTLTVTRVIDRFRRCLSGTALEDWDLIRGGTNNANTQAHFQGAKFEMMEEYLEKMR